MSELIKKIKSKSKDSFGDTKWVYNPKNDKKSMILNWFSKLPKGSKILEAGCGAGNYVVSLAKLGHKPIGLEIDGERVKIAKKYMEEYGLSKNIIFEGNLTKIPFKDEEFDAIFCHGVIEHIPDSEAAVREMTRVLKKGGYAMISVPNRYTSFTISKVLLQTVDNIFKTKLWNVGYEKSFPQWRFKKMLSRHLKIVEFRKREVQPGTTFPIYGKILRALDKPLWILGIGGGWLYAWCRK
ncbi:hypothetical protein AUJ84_02035 [Candidatus Pacearchaeota archaeon CG1_02_32_132]|nr:MAG: hypothetical protein AUJ84_02035 [Candidatus Pacearchaeota archaeon CG1_02_32_132]